MMLGMVGAVSAASIFDITFPIPELGNCADRGACKAYCDDLSRADDCAAFGKAHGLGAPAAQQPIVLPSTGPGGCTTGSACKTYCDDSIHFDECINFGEQHGLISKKEIQQARKPVTKGPGGCSDITECKTYCSDTSHHLECADYAHRQGQISDNDYEKVKDVTQNGGPGECKSEQECQVYCKDPLHLDECLSFGEKHGFISYDNAATIRKAGLAGPGPGGCQGNQACHAYCEISAHQGECIDFAVEKGFMTKGESEQARKFAGKAGPGGCVGGEKCGTYCENPDHVEACLDHAQQESLASKQEIDQARKVFNAAKQGWPGGCKGAKECRAYCKDPAHQQDCLDFAKKQGLVRVQDEKEFQAGLKIRKTVEQNGGPGGCKNDDECKGYCADPSHTEECIAFATAHGGISGDEARQMLQEFTSAKFSANPISPDQLPQLQQDSDTRFQEFKQLEKQFRGLGVLRLQTARDMKLEAKPGAFPDKQPGEVGPTGENTDITAQPGFVGPGGCTNGSGCITYCAQHKDECFKKEPSGEHEQKNTGISEGEGDGFGKQRFGNQFGSKTDRQEPEEGTKEFALPPGRGFGSGGERQGGVMPQLRGNIVHEIKSEDLPQGFEQRTREEKQQFFKEKFQEFKGQGQEGAFPGKPSQGFPGNQNPGQNFGRPESNQDNDQQEGVSDKFHGIAPTQGTRGIAPFEDKQQQQNNSGKFPPGYSGREGQQPFMQKDFNGQRPPTQGDVDTQQKQFAPRPGTYPFGGDSGQNQNQPYPVKSPYAPLPFNSSGGQQMPVGGSYPKQGEGYPTQPDGQFPQPSGYPQFPSGGTGGLAPSPGFYPSQIPSGSTGSYPPSPSGTTGIYQPPTGTGGTYVPPPSGSMSPPPSGSTGTYQPPTGSTGGTYVPPPSGSTGGSFAPPSSFAPFNALFAGLLQAFFGR